MRILQIGLGSMGKRRIRDLLALGHEVVGLDIREDRQEEAKEKYGIEITPLITSVDTWIISVPPKDHYLYAEMAMEHIPFHFMEANAIPHPFELKNSFISATWRFHPLITWIKDQNFTDVKSVKWYCQSDIEKWHPNEDIKNFYVGEGDICLREMVCYECQALFWLFGQPKNIESKIEKVGETCITKDKATLSFKTDKNIKVELLVDLVSKIPKREMHIEFTDMVRDWRLYTTGKIIERTYAREIKAFIDALENKAIYPYTIEEDKYITTLVDRIFKGKTFKEGFLC